MKRAVLWDSSAVVALLDADDARHADACTVAERLVADGAPGFMTNFIEAETHALLLRKLGRGAALQWLLARQLPIVRSSPADEERARAILVRHADKDWSLCDAVSFAVMDARRVTTAFSFDRHFRQYGRFRVFGLDATT